MAGGAAGLPKWQPQQISCRKSLARILPVANRVPQKNIFSLIFGMGLFFKIPLDTTEKNGIIVAQKERELKMRKFRSYSSSYRPYGSDDGYDYHRDNRDGSVDEYIKFVEEWRKEQAEKKKTETPKSGG